MLAVQGGDRRLLCRVQVIDGQRQFPTQPEDGGHHLSDDGCGGQERISDNVRPRTGN